MRINVNNNGYIEIDPAAYGITVTSYDNKGNVMRRDGFDEGEIVMSLNLLRNMRDDGQKSVYLMQDDTKEYLRNLIRNSDLSEFQIFQ